MFVAIKYILFVAVSIVGALCVIAPCVAADEEDVSIFDKFWSYATLYENEDNRLIQKFALSGRLQPESAWFEADQGQFIDYFLWRRLRFGFKTNLFQEWVLHIEADFDLNESLGNNYTRLTDAYIGWVPRKNLDLKVLKQSAGFTLDGATSSKKLLTLQRNDLTNNLWFTQEYFTGITAKGDIGESWSYNVGIFSSDGSDELSHFEASYFTLPISGNVSWRYSTKKMSTLRPEIFRRFSRWPPSGKPDLGAYGQTYPGAKATPSRVTFGAWY